MFDFGGGCKVGHIREVDWYKKTTREYDYGVVTYWLVAANGARLSPERSEDFPPNEKGPDYTYICVACDEHFWFWSDVIVHVKDADS